MSAHAYFLSHVLAIERAWERVAPFPWKQTSDKMAADLNFAYLFSFRGDKAENQGFYFKHSSKRGVSFIYLFQQRNSLHTAGTREV